MFFVFFSVIKLRRTATFNWKRKKLNKRLNYYIENMQHGIIIDNNSRWTDIARCGITYRFRYLVLSFPWEEKLVYFLTRQNEKKKIIYTKNVLSSQYRTTSRRWAKFLTGKIYNLLGVITLDIDEYAVRGWSGWSESGVKASALLKYLDSAL